MTKIKRLFKNNFANLETTTKSIIFILIPVAVFFSVLSDRTPYNYFNLIVYGLLAIAIIFYVLKYKSFKFDIFTVLILSFNFIILLSQLINKRIAEYPRTVALLSLFSILVYQFFINIDNKQDVFTAILIGGFIFAAYFVFYYRKEIIKFDFSDRIGRDFSDQNDLAKYLSLFCILSIGLFFKTKIVGKIVFILFAGLFFFLILFTGSISNLLCIIVTVIFIFIFNPKRQNRWFVIFGIVLAVGLFVLLLQLPVFAYFKERLERIFSGLSQTTYTNSDGSALDRLALFKEALRLFVTRPLFGFGYDQVKYYTHGAGAFSHNNFTELGASFGVFGLLIFEILILMPLVKMIKEKKIDSQSLFLIFYLFIFQIFLIIFRKKIEFILMPLFFSISCFGYYSYFELKLANKKFNFKFVKATKALDEKLDKEKAKLKVLHLFSPDEFTLDYLNNFNSDLSSLCDIKNIAIVDASSELTDNDSYQVYKLGAKLLKLRKLSFMIDEIKPDVVYVDSKILNGGLLDCIGFSKKVVCYLRKDFDEKKVHKSKKMQYITFDCETKTRFENLFKKKKCHVTVIDSKTYSSSNKKTRSKTKKYASVFFGSELTEDNYKEAVERFVELHKNNIDMRFAIIANDYAYEKLDEYFKKESVDYIDLYKETDNVKEVLNESKSTLLLTGNRLDCVSIDLFKSCNNLVIHKETKESIVELDNFGFECDDSNINEAILNVFNNAIDKESKDLNEEIDFDSCYLQYEYIKVFML